jgi:hypothetical protein
MEYYSSVYQSVLEIDSKTISLHAANTLILNDTVVGRFLLSSSTFSGNNARINGLFEDCIS